MSAVEPWKNSHHASRPQLSETRVRWNFSRLIGKRVPFFYLCRFTIYFPHFFLMFTTCFAHKLHTNFLPQQSLFVSPNKIQKMRSQLVFERLASRGESII